MARLWLLLPEIREAVEFASDAIITVDYDDPSDEVKESTEDAKALLTKFSILEER